MDVPERMDEEQRVTFHKALGVLEGEAPDLSGPQGRGFTPRSIEVPWAASHVKKGNTMLDIGFSLANLQERGVLYISPATEVYEGQVIGNTSKGEEMPVNPTKGKQLTNMRASGTDEAISLVPAFEITIERGLEIMAEDEYLEITPKSVRLRKQYLTEIDRSRARRAA